MSRDARHDLVLKALGDARRREMLDMLREAPRTTGELCDHFKNLDRCTVMQHLGVLERADLVIVKRSGRNRWNYINPLPIKEIHDRWISGYADGAIDLLARMKRDIERKESADYRDLATSAVQHPNVRGEDSLPGWGIPTGRRTEERQ